MNTLKLSVIIFFFVNVIFGQNYPVGHTTITFTDASRSNRSIPAEIYYPATTAGTNVPVTTATTEQFPVLVFGHGFLMGWDSYQNFWDALVPKGYIMVFPKTEGSTSPSHLEFGKDLAFLVNQMNSLSGTSTSIFYNRVSAMNCVLGHSMGGGSSYLSIAQNANIKTLVNLSAAETTPSAIAAAGSITIWSLVFAGSNDCVAPPASNQVSMYNALASTCKTYISITGASHCQMANSNFICSAGEGFCSAPTITRATQHTLIFKYLIPWLDFQLKANCSQGALFDSQITVDSAITFNKNCIQCNNLTADNFENKNTEVVVFPNPTKGKVTFKTNNESSSTIKIVDILGKEIATATFVEQFSFDVSKYASGTYFYELTDVKGMKTKGKFVKE